MTYINNFAQPLLQHLLLGTPLILTWYGRHIRIIPQAFFCNDNVEGNRGDLTTCPDGQIIRPNFLQDTVQCIDRVSNYQCPGSFNVKCAEDEIVLNPDACECDGQV